MEQGGSRQINSGARALIKRLETVEWNNTASLTLPSSGHQCGVLCIRFLANELDARNSVSSRSPLSNQVRVWTWFGALNVFIDPQDLPKDFLSASSILQATNFSTFQAIDYLFRLFHACSWAHFLSCIIRGLTHIILEIRRYLPDSWPFSSFQKLTLPNGYQKWDWIAVYWDSGYLQDFDW